MIKEAREKQEEKRGNERAKKSRRLKADKSKISSRILRKTKAEIQTDSKETKDKKRVPVC